MLEVLGLHLVLCAVAAFCLARTEQPSAYRFTTAFFIPFAGVAYLMLLRVLKSGSTEQGTIIEALAITDSVTIPTGLGPANKIEYEQELNVVSIEEALVINSDAIKRKQILDIYKEEPVEYISILEAALNDTDSETLHYAAAGLSDIRTQFSVKLQELSSGYADDSSNLDVLKPYAETLKSCLSSSLLDAATRHRYTDMYSRVLADLLEVEPRDSLFVEKINNDIALREYDRAKKYCDKYLAFNESSEEPYLMYLKYYFAVNDRYNFNLMMANLKSSSARFSSKGLSIVRYWADAL